MAAQIHEVHDNGTIEVINEVTGEIETFTVADMKIGQMRDILAADFRVELPKSWKRQQVLGIFNGALHETPDTYQQYVQKPIDTTGTSANPIVLDREAIKARVQQHEEQLSKDEAERIRLAAEKAKTKRKSWEPTTDELRSRVSKVAYAMGVLRWAQNRINKEMAVVTQIQAELEMDPEILSIGREGAVQGYAKSWDQFKHPSPACTGINDDTLSENIWKELMDMPEANVLEFLNPIDLELLEMGNPDSEEQRLQEMEYNQNEDEEVNID